MEKHLSKETSFYEFQSYIYDYFKEKRYGGVFEGRQPRLYIFDVVIIKTITLRHSEYFIDCFCIERNRSTIRFERSFFNSMDSSPISSSAGLKNLLPLLRRNSDQMMKFLQQNGNNRNFDMNDMMGRLILEAIGTYALQIKAYALKHQNDRSIKWNKHFSGTSTDNKTILSLVILMLLPNLMKNLDTSMHNPEVTEELVKILKVTKAEKRKAESGKKYFLQSLIETVHKEKHEAAMTHSIIQSENTIDLQSLLFLIAGYEISRTLISFGIHTLVTNPGLQYKLRDHIMEVTIGRDLSYELLSELNYLEAFFLETLRLYPTYARLLKTCTKEYFVPDTCLTLDVGDVIAIPVYGIHMDPKIYPDPHEFRPERFLVDEIKHRPFHLYLGFGIGPRSSITMRFAMLSAKIAMVSLLENFKFTACGKSENPVSIDRNSLVLKPANGIWVKIENL